MIFHKQTAKKTAELLAKLTIWRNEIGAPIPTELNPEYDSNFVPQKKKQ